MEESFVANNSAAAAAELLGWERVTGMRGHVIRRSRSVAFGKSKRATSSAVPIEIG